MTKYCEIRCPCIISLCVLNTLEAWVGSKYCIEYLTTESLNLVHSMIAVLPYLLQVRENPTQSLAAKSQGSKLLIPLFIMNSARLCNWLLWVQLMQPGSVHMSIQVHCTIPIWSRIQALVLYTISDCWRILPWKQSVSSFLFPCAKC